MAKLTLDPVVSGYASVAKLNANFDLIEAAVENTLSRNGTSPNEMGSDLDMNSNRILNLPAPTSSHEPARFIDLTDSLELTGVVVPALTGNAGKFLKTDGSSLSWAYPNLSFLSTFGAVGDGATDDTAAIQAALDSLSYNGTLIFDAKVFPSRYLISDTLTAPRWNGISLIGEGGQLSTQIFFPTAAGAKIMTFGTGTEETSNINNVTIRNIAFVSDGTAGDGLYMESVSRSTIEGCYFNNLAGAAYHVYCCLANRFINNQIGACATGILQDTTLWTGLNGWFISGNYIGGCSGWGMDIQQAMTGSSITGNVIEGNISGGIRFAQTSHGIDIRGNYFEENRPAANNANSTDILIAESTYCTAIVVEGNYFNGSIHASDYYYPIRMHFARGCRFKNNYIGTGSKWVKFEANSNTNNEFGYTEFWNGDFVASYDSQPSFNFAAGALESFLNGKNRITHDFGTGIPPSPISLTATDDFSAGWTSTLAGASTWTAATNGARTVYKLTRSGGVAEVERTITIGARENVEARGAFTTFAFDLYTATALGGVLTISDNLGVVDTYTLNGSAGAWQTFYITMCKSAPTSMKIKFEASTNGDYYLGRERWVVSADYTAIV